MARSATTIHEVSNAELAAMLDEAAVLLARQGASGYRVAAYRRAAALMRRLAEPLAQRFQSEGRAGLERLPGIGKSLARKLAEIISHGRSRYLERLRRKNASGDLLTTLPGVGPRLARRIEEQLGGSSLDTVWSAARDGRLSRVDGLGRKRVRAIRESLAARLQRNLPPPVPAREGAPSVAVLLAIDAEYRRLAQHGKLPLSRPRQFNPTGAASLPIYRTRRGSRLLCAHFANTARSHASGNTFDWVVIYSLDKQFSGQWTVRTATAGKLRGKRIVRGRERECFALQKTSSLVQLKLLP